MEDHPVIIAAILLKLRKNLFLFFNVLLWTCCIVERFPIKAD